MIENDGVWVRDYGGGTVVSGVRIADRRRLDNADRLEFGPLHFELLIQDAPVKATNRAPDLATQAPDVAARVPVAATIADKLPERVERPAAAPELPDLDCQSVIVAGWTPPTDWNLNTAGSESPKVPSGPHTAPAEQAEPAAVELNDRSAARSESPRVPPEPLTARAESPKVPPEPLTARPKHAEPAARPQLISAARSESPKVVLPWYATPTNREEPAPVVAGNLLRRFFTAKSAFNDQNAAPAVRPKVLLAWLLSMFLRLFPSDRLEPNVMFLLGILVGIGLSAAGLAFFSIAKH